ncbi:MAG: tetratricopeptide repeat protein [Steroidobacteraceae bacterium]|jgi:tetratricopeptide (TPR) repeat protein|nr:tetratricopeptide repeat protein [Steroidobacteraceae bacterium]
MNRRHTWSVPLLLLAFAAGLAGALEPEPRGGTATRNADVLAAELARERGDCRGSAEAYVKASRATRDPRIARRATDVALECAHLPAAWQAASRWRELDPENVDALRAAGLVALELWRIDEARALFRDLLAKPDVEPDRALGELLPLVAEGDHVHAAWLAFGGIVDRRAVSADTLLALARLAAAADDFGGARQVLGQLPAGELQPGTAAAVARLRARLAAAEGEPGAEAALESARQAARADPGEHAFAVAETLVDLDRAEEAHRELERLQGDPANAAEAGRRLALLALGSGDFAEAQQRFGARLQQGEGAAEALFYLGVIAERRGSKDLALQSYQRLAEAGAGLLPRARAASLLIERGERARALALLDEFGKSNRDAAIDVAVARGQLLADADDFDAALGAISEALARHPEHPNLLYQRAMLLERAGRTREAVKAFEALLKARPEDATVQNALGYTLADRRQQLARAEQLIRKAVAARPDNAAFLDSLGWVLYRRGDARAATPLLERAWRLSQEAEIAAHWGEVLWVSGSQSEARTVWARALARAPDSAPLRATIERFTGKPVPAATVAPVAAPAQ